jgi:hypothetical protein
MEDDNYKWLRRKFWKYRNKVTNLKVPDIYEPGQKELIEIVKKMFER